MCRECGDESWDQHRLDELASVAAPALAELGPERVERARRITALPDWDKRGWEGCFLALAYGEPRELAAACERAAGGPVLTAPHPSAESIVAHVLGIRRAGVCALVELFDNHVPGGRARLRSLVDEYLERNRAAGCAHNSAHQALEPVAK